MSPWWTDQQAAWIGAIGGSAIGLIGAILGTLGGICVPRGKCKGWVLGLMAFNLVAGVALLTAGIVGLTAHQPYAVWYPLVLGGGILGFVNAGLLPVVRARYREADRRRLQAEELRRS
jgi:hypothetical protein